MAKGSEQSNVKETGTRCTDLAHCPLNVGRVLHQQFVNQVLLPCLCSCFLASSAHHSPFFAWVPGRPAYLPHCPCEHCHSAESLASFHWATCHLLSDFSWKPRCSYCSGIVTPYSWLMDPINSCFNLAFIHLQATVFFCGLHLFSLSCIFLFTNFRKLTVSEEQGEAVMTF